MDFSIDGETDWKKRFGINLDGPIIPFGTEWWYRPSYSVDQERLHKYGNKMFAGIFVGYEQHAGCGWTGDVWVIDQEEIVSSEFNSEVTPTRF